MSTHHAATPRQPQPRRWHDGAAPDTRNLMLDAEYDQEQRADIGLDYDAGRVTRASLSRLLARCATTLEGE